MSDLLAERDAWSMANCSIARTLEIVGTRTAMLILREAFLGTRRFDDFARRIGIGEPATAARLKELTAAGLLERVPYREPGQRTRYAYQLTEKGRDFLPVLTALRQWGDTWVAGEQGRPVVARHKQCGGEVRAVLRCEEGHDVPFGESYIDAGPGLLRLEADGA
ncbi:winged helix-turn-helix transcriptional regulator [Streptomyces thermodiastaticus]|jgi:DNA-binding HxlR family transcriptional regulator|uniref:winged helix-turn-helix transcriptional regulator n=1 Tax=Streptomyces thermodiastaticus TaxID=44061 RepID=UPI001675AF11|nr:helix-turn-helix domain-containing protein [Streptomyces thermodiastaticus]MCE7549069.1 helix-turn-helix transcriptional regulator [Streptomyces thermodiastaticus]GHF59890.1 transcriptional regulator family protein [Streptomyces thermodiastaticus]